MNLENQTALVTGGGRGIGKAISATLASAGAHVYLGGTNLETAEETAQAICDNGGKASPIQLDVSNKEDIQNAFDRIIGEAGRLDILVNNAGITKDGLMIRMKEEDWDRVLEVNLKGAFLCSQLAVKQMMKQKSGNIINISSIVGQAGNAGQANYTASKSALIGLTKTMAQEAAPRGIRVNAIAPGFIETDMTGGLNEKIREGLMGKIPLGKLGSSQDVADGVLFLASCRASYITGQVLNINGGMLM